MVMPEEGTISWPSLRHVMRIGMSPDATTQAMYINLPMEVGGKSNGWISGGTETKGKREGNVWVRLVAQRVSKRQKANEVKMLKSQQKIKKKARND